MSKCQQIYPHYNCAHSIIYSSQFSPKDPPLIELKGLSQYVAWEKHRNMYRDDVSHHGYTVSQSNMHTSCHRHCHDQSNTLAVITTVMISQTHYKLSVTTPYHVHVYITFPHKLVLTILFRTYYNKYMMKATNIMVVINMYTSAQFPCTF